MNVKPVMLNTLRQEIRQLDKTAFFKQYPGAFLLAMGFLAVEKILAQRGMAKGGPSGQDPTAAIIFGPKLRHDSAQAHPLAGLALFLLPTGDKLYVDIGRNNSCDIAVPDSSVSEQHCRVEVTREGVMVIDNGSTNGTTVNLMRLEPNVPQLIADEDILSVGRYSFQLLSSKTMYDELALLNAMDLPA
jgi:hypothetical protein